jgi:drug/metabolite transporter (DMT)-like permease
MPRSLVAILLMLGTMALFVTTDTCAKIALRSYPASEVVWVRFVFHLPVVLLALARGADLRTRRPGLQLLRSMFQVASTAFFFLAIQWLPLPTAFAIILVQPLLLTALSVPFLGERVGPRRWTAVALGFIGALIVVRPGPTMDWSAILALGTAFSSAGYQIVTRRVAAIDSPAASLFYTAAFGAAVASAIVPFEWRTPPLADWPFLVAIGLMAGLGHLLLIEAFARAPASILAPFTYSQLVWATLLGFLVFGDVPDAPTLIGATIIVGSGLYVFYRERAAQASTSTSHSGRTSEETTTSVEAGRASPVIRSRTAR